MNVTSAWLWLVIPAAIGAVSCAQILGNDFCRSDEADCPTASTGGAGGSGGANGQGGGGAGGGAGGEGPVILDCSLVSGSSAEIGNGEGFSAQWSDEMVVTANGDDQIFVALERGSTIDVYRKGTTGSVVTEPGDLLAIHVIGDDEVGFLFYEGDNLNFRRSKSAMSSIVVSEAIVDRADFATVSGGRIAVVANNDLGGDAKAMFGAYDSPAINLMRFTEFDVNLAAEDMRPVAVVRQGVVNHIFLGDNNTALSSSRYYTFDDDGAAEGPPALTFPDGFYVVSAVAVSGSTLALSVLDANVGDGFTLRYGTVAFDDLPTAALDEFPVIAELSLSEIPPADPVRTETHLGIAAPTPGDAMQSSLLVVSFAEGVQATGTLDISGEISGAEAISAVRVRPRDGFPTSPTLDVFVITEHESASYKKLHTLEMSCSAP
jgi:hypothetical protein